MDSQSTEQLIQILIYILGAVVIILLGLGIYWGYLKYRQKMSQNVSETKKENRTTNVNSDKDSIFNFMEFDEVEDNMIIQKNATRFLMVVECQGVNYDLMSGVEKNGVEEGFVQFLNSLRNTIQIYIQTRAINLENSLTVYREKIKEIENKYENMKMRYEEMLDSDDYTDEQLAKAKYELTKQSNLYEYGVSIVKDTERMSLNKNILSKNYYIIVPYYASEASNEKLDKAELKNVAFSELYTRAQSIISSLSACGVKGKILRTNELIELLYIAYNRDEAETLTLDRLVKAGFSELYSTAPDVYEKKIKELDKIIKEKAMIKAREKVQEAQSELEMRAKEKEDNMEDIINDVARMILEDNEQYLGTEVKNLAAEKLSNTEEGGKSNGKKTRGRRKNAVV